MILNFDVLELVQVLDLGEESRLAAEFPGMSDIGALNGRRANGIDPKTRIRIEAGAGILATDYVRMTRARQAAIRSFENSFSENDVFIVPTTPIRAPLLSSVADDAAFHEANGLVLRNPRFANLLDCPSISLPLPVNGLPAGLMLIGRRNSDRRLLQIASCVEAGLSSNVRL